MALGVSRVEMPHRNQLGHHGVICGEQLELFGPDPVGPAVADVTELERPVGMEHAQGQRCSHASQIRVSLDLSEHLVVARHDALDNGDVRIHGLSGCGLQGGRARHVAGDGTAHAVGHPHEDGRIRRTG